MVLYLCESFHVFAWGPVVESFWGNRHIERVALQYVLFEYVKPSRFAERMQHLESKYILAIRKQFVKWLYFTLERGLNWIVIISLTTEFAHKWFFTRVNPSMLFHVPFLWKSFAAVVACMWFISGMNPQVSIQVGTLSKSKDGRNEIINQKFSWLANFHLYQKNDLCYKNVCIRIVHTFSRIARSNEYI